MRKKSISCSIIAISYIIVSVFLLSTRDSLGESDGARTLLSESKLWMLQTDNPSAIEFSSSEEEVAAEITQAGKVFTPNKVTISAGQKIKIINDDEVVHNAYCRDPSKTFNLGGQKPGSYDVVEFSDTGEYTIRCAIHPKMKLSIVVE